MENFADQCLDMAQSILGHNLESISEQGTISPIAGEESRLDEPGHAALAIGEYYRVTNQATLGDFDLVDLAARCVTAQAFTEEEYENGLAYSALGLLSFGPAKDRNPVWERLLDPTREQLDKRLLERSDYENHFQSFNIAKAVTRFSLGLSKKDETGRLIDRFLERIETKSSGGFFDDSTSGEGKLGGAYDVYGVMSFVFIRQALQLHANLHLRDRKLPSLRTHAEKFLKLIPDMARQDGAAFAYGRSIGAYGQMHCISLVLQALRDGWISDSQRDVYTDAVRRMFMNFFVTYLDQEHGYLVIRDEERDTVPYHTTRMANFDAARYLCQWARLARATGGDAAPKSPVPPRKVARFISFDKSHRKEQGLFVYQDPNSGLALQLPLVGSADQGLNTSDYLAFPHSPGVFDWPVDKYLPIMQPELTFGDHVVVPSFYGKNCTISMGLRNSLNFKYDQPELITKDQKMVNGLGSCKVTWSFAGNKLTCEFCFTVKQQVQLDRMRYILAIASPHSRYRIGTAFTLGQEGHRTNVVKDDFQAEWKDLETVTNDPEFRTYYGNMHYLQILERDHPLIMRPGMQYRLALSFEPDIAFADE
ncbi:hypothetical protein [Coraliomargarita akajimensis]|uniref:Uncharacterized protein n=1 Tax=Coraliomargarita akajimensis (strain DSM 45221 / IAM 15411 / JCM 23193 / KCTC 12865 / 04OKA010-24) TaxID=583355 RepID=D5EHP8_CORAD|nr:hypothetical protein [Coraliomargarita akajimensis]ADE54089.1 conserved hypothetical protein [Coraliomargarita akajimensis DSM 45221]